MANSRGFAKPRRDRRKALPKSAFAIVAIASLALLETPAWAVPTGITGYSGKYNKATCAQCHTGGTAPKVTLTGPTALTAGQVAEYSFHVETNAAIVGMDAAATDGVNVTPGTNTRQDFTDVVQSQLETPSGGAVDFTFHVEAPAYNGPFDVFAAALAANNNRNTSGDGAAGAKVSVTVTGGVDPPPPDSDDAGVDASSSNGSSGSGDETGGLPPPPWDGGTSRPVRDSGLGGLNGDGGSGAADDGSDWVVDKGGCAVTRPFDPSGAFWPGGLGLLGIVAMVRGIARRPRSK